MQGLLQKPSALVSVPPLSLLLQQPPSSWDPQDCSLRGTLSRRLLSWASEALLQEPGFELMIKVALDPKGTGHLIDLGDRCLPQQWAQKIFHILLQGPNVPLHLPDHSHLTVSMRDVPVDWDVVHPRAPHEVGQVGWGVSRGLPTTRSGIMFMLWGLWDAGGG